MIRPKNLKRRKRAADAVDEVIAFERKNVEERKTFDDKLLQFMNNISENSRKRTEQEQQNGIIFQQLSQALINSLKKY